MYKIKSCTSAVVLNSDLFPSMSVWSVFWIYCGFPTCINLKRFSSTAPADPKVTGTPGAHQHHSAHCVRHGYWTDPTGRYPPPAQLLRSRGPDGQLHPQKVQWASSTTIRFAHHSYIDQCDLNVQISIFYLFYLILMFNSQIHFIFLDSHFNINS